MISNNQEDLLKKQGCKTLSDMVYELPLQNKKMSTQKITKYRGECLTNLIKAREKAETSPVYTRDKAYYSPADQKKILEQYAQSAKSQEEKSYCKGKTEDDTEPEDAQISSD